MSIDDRSGGRPWPPEGVSRGADVRERRPVLWFHCAALVLYTSITLVYLAPLARRFTTHIAPDPGDPVFNLYLMSWVSDRAEHSFRDLWNPPFFHPAKNVLALSDHMIGPGLLFAALERWLPSRAAAYNALFLGSFVLCGWTSAWVYRRAGCSAAAALIAGGLFTFAPYRWDQLSHLQVLWVPWLPLVLWFWHRFLESPGWREAGLFFTVYALHVSGGSYLGYLIHFPLAVLLLLRLMRRRQAPTAWAMWRRLFVVCGACAALLLALNLPYLTAVPGVIAERGASAAAIWGATAMSYLTPSTWNRSYKPWAERLFRPENALFPGWLCSALAVLALVVAWHRGSPETTRATLSQRIGLASFTALAAGAAAAGDVRTWRSPHGELQIGDLPSHADLGVVFMVALGSFAVLARLIWGRWPGARLHLDSWWRGLLASGAVCFLLSFPFIWVLLAKLLPGLDRMRVPTRVQPFVIFALSGFAALGCDLLLTRMRRRSSRALLLAGLIVLALVDCAPRPLRIWELVYLPPPPELRPVYHWLKSAEEVTAVAELPAFADYRDTSYLYYSLYHRRPIVNGFSGHIPVGYSQAAALCAGRTPISRGCVEAMRARGASHLLLHLRTNALHGAPRRRPRTLAPGVRSNLELIWSDRTDQVYRIRNN